MLCAGNQKIMSAATVERIGGNKMAVLVITLLICAEMGLAYLVKKYDKPEDEKSDAEKAVDRLIWYDIFKGGKR